MDREGPGSGWVVWLCDGLCLVCSRPDAHPQGEQTHSPGGAGRKARNVLSIHLCRSSSRARWVGTASDNTAKGPVTAAPIGLCLWKLIFQV